MSKQKLLYGVGINDAGYTVQKNVRTGTGPNGKPTYKMVWICPYYKLWRSILNRCYSTYAQEVTPCYLGASVCEEWLTFSTFRGWAASRNMGEGMAIEKDILNPGNKVYSPEFCDFVPVRVNSLLTSFKSDKGDYPVGVSAKHCKNEEVMYVARVHNGYGKESEYLGRHSTPEKAHAAWQKAKADVIDETVLWWHSDSAVNHTFIEGYAEALWARSEKLRQDLKGGIETVSFG